MSRSIRTASAGSADTRTRSLSGDDEFTAGEPVDGYTDRMVKLIPAEVVAFYLFATSSLESAAATLQARSVASAAGLAEAQTATAQTVAAAAPWIVLLFGGVATYFYLRYPLHVTNARQLALTVGAFFVWAFSLGFPFTEFDWYLEAYGGIVLAAYTLIAPYVPMEANA